jgi:hypothetical protein
MAYTPTAASVLMTDYVEPTLRDTFEEEANTFNAFMDGDKIRTNIRGRRISYNVAPNPSYGSHVSGAPLPVGGTGAEIEAKVFYFNQFMVGEIHKEVLEQDNDKAIIGLLKNRQSRDTSTFRQRQNLWMFGRGDGALAVISDASGGTTVVMGGDYGSENIIVGSRLWFYSAAGVRRTGGGAVTSTVLTNDTVDGGSTITLDQVPNDLAATDTVHYEASFGNAPHGLSYHITDVSGDWFGINTATYSNIKSTVHDANNNALLPGMIDLAQAKARKRTGVNAPVNDRALLSHTAQELNYRQLGYDLFRNVAASGNAKLDLGFPAVAHNGMRWKLDANCQRSILYGLKLRDFRIVFIRLPGFYALANGDKLWQKPTEGGVYDRLQYALVARYDLLCYERRNQWKIENLPYIAGV